ncbi:hypothetical protein BB559_001453 [Furculomyces boomerangus]|uniref:Oxidase FUB9 n=1 Tax=Furculomyces boomerangus TaxID=61424 RepID=A0A2T9Z1Z3_9FUNG|nr:hypothetical protein BB559_001453 [Furculomyces boomerangus]
MSKIASLSDIEKSAFQKLDKNALDYYSSGAQDEITHYDNKKAFDRYQIRPRFLRDVSKVDMSTEIFGEKFSSPIFVAASGMQKMAHPIGEVGSARSACKHGVCYSLSTVSTTSLEEVSESVQSLVAEGHKSVRWFQLYVYKEKERTIALIRRAEKAGFTAILITVDTPFLGRRLANIRNAFKMPKHLKLANFETEEDENDEKEFGGSDGSYWLPKYVTSQIDPGLSWEDVKWIKSQTHLPVLVKGVLTHEDAKIALDSGIDGIIVSNHGGRQLDSVSATIDALAEVVSGCENKIPVLLDGGVMRGTDVFKAIALGAKAVFVGRPVLWSLAHDGENGVDLMLDILSEEFRMAMALSGCTSIKDINRNYIQLSPKYYIKL